MRASSPEQLRGQIAAGEYAIDPSDLAGKMLADFALVRRVRRELERPEAPADNGQPTPPARTRRRGAAARRLPGRKDAPRW